MARAKKSKTSVKVNFKGIESRKTPPQGDYVASVLEANNSASSQGNDQIEFVLEISRGESKGSKLWFYCPIIESSLWKLHAFMTALGEDVPEDEVDIDLADLVGKELVVVLSHETYQGKKRAKITDFQSIEEYDGDADMDDGKKSAGGKVVNYSKMDEDDLRELYIERELGDKKAAKKLDEEELIEALEEADAELKKTETKKPSGKKKPADDDDDDDEKPAKGKAKAGAKKKVKKYDKDEVEDMDEDELQELIDEADLDVDLDDFKKLPKKVAAVIAELEEKDLLDD